MAMLVLDPHDQNQILENRRACDGDRFDEVWDGVYMMSPLADNQHQEFQSKLIVALTNALGWNTPFKICAGVNVSDNEDNWEHNYRCPDVVVFAPDTKAKNCDTFWLGGPDFAVEITSPHDRSREKFDFYARVGVRELLILDRRKWSLELYRLANSKMQLAEESTPTGGTAITSQVLNIMFRLAPGMDRPTIEVAAANGQSWLI
jgi:Uma2 family endonuclease